MIKFFISILVIKLYFVTYIHSEIINEIIAIVAKNAITSVELDQKITLFKKNPVFNPYYKRDNRNLKSQALDTLIQEAIIDYYANEQSITVTDKKLENQLTAEMNSKNIKTKKDFEKILYQAYKIKLDDYKQILKRQIIYQQVAQIVIQAPPVSQNDIKKWYNKNKNKLGNKFKYQIIGIPFKRGDVKSELNANKLIVKASKVAKKNFSKAAKQYSKLPNAKKGGLVNYKSIESIARENPYIAQVITQLPLNKLQSEIPIENWYYIVRVLGKKSLPFKEAKNLIQQQIYLEYQQKAMRKWIEEKKLELSVKVFFKNYYAPP